MARFASILAVAIGGVVGSLVRWAAVNAAGETRSTLTILGLNVAGSILFGWLLGRRDRLTDERFALMGAGLAGGLTTFSTFAVAVAQRLEEGALGSAAANGLSTLALTLIGAGLGYRLSILFFIARRTDARLERRKAGAPGRATARLGAGLGGRTDR